MKSLQVNSKDVTVRINYYDKASGKKIGEDFEHVTVAEGEDPVVLKAADLGTFTVDGVEYQVADDAVDCTVEYRENVSEVYWAVSMNKIEKPEVNSKDVTVRINYYDKASGEKIGEAFEHVTVAEGEDPVVRRLPIWAPLLLMGSSIRLLMMPLTVPLNIVKM